MYLTDAHGTLYLAEEVDPRHMPAAGPLYRLTPVDILAATKASLAATAAWLAEHKASDAIPSEAPGEGSGSATVDALPAPPSSEGPTPVPCPASRPGPSGAISAGGAPRWAK